MAAPAPAIWMLLLAAARIDLRAPSEVVARLEMSSPGANWGQRDREAAVADVALDGRVVAQVMLYAGSERHRYDVFLGRLGEGSHEVRVERNGRYSAPGAGLELRSVNLEAGVSGCLAHAPVLYARPDSVGRFTDTPLLMYCERFGDRLEYTAIFSNEDGGTSTRALMARWGRTTDIEYVYRVWLGEGGRPARAAIQAKGHNEVEFRGRREAFHPLLMAATDNNMVSDEGESPLRFQPAPVEVDLSNGARELVMDRSPWTYRVMAEELAREAKLRPYGAVDGQKIGDPRNYVFLEAKIANRDSRLAARVRLEGERRWRSSHLGHSGYAIERDGWIRTTVELPPGTTPARVAEIGFECLGEPAAKDKPAPVSGSCRLEAVSRVFFLDESYRPGPSFWSLGSPEAPTGARIPPAGGSMAGRSNQSTVKPSLTGETIPTGEFVAFRVAR